MRRPDLADSEKPRSVGRRRPIFSGCREDGRLAIIGVTPLGRSSHKRLAAQARGGVLTVRLMKPQRRASLAHRAGLRQLAYTGAPDGWSPGGSFRGRNSRALFSFAGADLKGEAGPIPFGGRLRLFFIRGPTRSAAGRFSPPSGRRFLCRTFPAVQLEKLPRRCGRQAKFVC